MERGVLKLSSVRNMIQIETRPKNLNQKQSTACNRDDEKVQMEKLFAKSPLPD